jgi:hypothetical protein
MPDPIGKGPYPFPVQGTLPNGPLFNNLTPGQVPGLKIGDSTEAQRNPLQTTLNPPGPYWDSTPRPLVWRPVAGEGRITFRATYETPNFDTSPWLAAPSGQSILEAVPLWGGRGAGLTIKLQVQTLTSTRLTDLYLGYAEFGHIRDTSQIAVLGPEVDITQDMQGGGQAYPAIFEPPGYPYHIRFYRIRLIFTIRGTAVAVPPELYVCGAVN